MTARPTTPAPVPPPVEPRQLDWDDDPAQAGRADDVYWDDRYDAEPDDPADHYYC